MTEPVTLTKPAAYPDVPMPHYPNTAVMKNQTQSIVLAVMATVLVLIIGYQQVQIARLSSDLNLLTGNLRSGETRGHLEALDAKLQELNTRLTYLDSKIASTDHKAQSALDKIRINEEKADWFGNIMRGLGWK